MVDEYVKNMSFPLSVGQEFDLEAVLHVDICAFLAEDY